MAGDGERTVEDMCVTEMLLGHWKSIGRPLDWKPADVDVLQSPPVGHSV